MGKCFFIRTSPVLVFHTHTCLLIACLHAQCMLAYPSYPSLAYLHLHTLTLAYFALGCFHSSPYTVVEVSVCKCKCRSVSVCSANVVEVSVCKCKCRSVSVQGIFRKNPSQCFREKPIVGANASSRRLSPALWRGELPSRSVRSPASSY